MKKLDDLAFDYAETICPEIEKMGLNERQKIMAEIIVFNKLHDAMERALARMYDEGLLKKVEE